MLYDEIQESSLESRVALSLGNYFYFDDIRYNPENRLNNFVEYLNKNSSSKKKCVVFDQEGNLYGQYSSSISVIIDEIVLNEDKIDYILKNEDNGYYLYVFDGFEIKGVPYILCSRVNLSKLVKSSRDSFKILLYSISGIFLLVLCASYLFSKYLTKDIKKLQYLSNEVIDGNYLARSSVDSNDEIGDLAKSFDVMTETIHKSIESLNKEVEKSNKLFQCLTHEIKTPLTSIIGYADLLRKNEYDDELYNMGLLNIYNEGKRLSKLSSKLIQVVEFNKKALELETVNVIEILNKCILVQTCKAKNKNIEFLTDYFDFHLSVDTGIINNVILNIIDNAIEASSEFATIKVMTYEADTKVIAIEDEGKGISEDEISNIFTPFYKVDKSRSLSKNNLGLGLSIARDIMSLHGGKIEISSSLGKGTIVELHFTS